VDTYAALFTAASVIPPDHSETTSAGLRHGGVVIEFDALSIVFETVLPSVSSQILDDGLRV
jgi:hypothetical protein